MVFYVKIIKYKILSIVWYFYFKCKCIYLFILICMGDVFNFDSNKIGFEFGICCVIGNVIRIK